MSLKWIKLDSNFYFDDRMSLLKEYENTPIIKLIYIGLLCLCGRRGMGRLVHKNGQPYGVRVLSDMLVVDECTVSYAIDALTAVGFIGNDDGTLFIVDWNEYQDSSDSSLNTDEEPKIVKRRQEAKERMQRKRAEAREAKNKSAAARAENTVEHTANTCEQGANTPANSLRTDCEQMRDSLKYLSLEENREDKSITYSLCEEKTEKKRTQDASGVNPKGKFIFLF